MAVPRIGPEGSWQVSIFFIVFNTGWHRCKVQQTWIQPVFIRDCTQSRDFGISEIYLFNDLFSTFKNNIVHLLILRPGRQSRSRKSSAEKRLSRSRAEFQLSRSRKMFEPAEPSRKNVDVIIFNCIFHSYLWTFTALKCTKWHYLMHIYVYHSLIYPTSILGSWTTRRKHACIPCHKFSRCKNGVCLDVECWLMALLHSRFGIVLDQIG